MVEKPFVVHKGSDNDEEVEIVLAQNEHNIYQAM